ncbi:MAG: cation:proton antiporter [Bacteroidales bacterium]|jgi:NhaP-type Na+/H+ or K+/H+ antiporter|nr:cation:proton antiporter [Bacteroidales bacterium]
MEILNPYTVIIAVCIIIILSHQFNWISRLSNIPSVLLLILLGIGIRFGLDHLKIGVTEYLMDILVMIGTIGLIMIVLEAAMELELTRDKKGLITRSFLLALISLVACIALITWIFYTYLIDDFFTALLYAVPISVVSSAIVIPSVRSLIRKSKEFLIYESTFSDILGIMIFFYLLSSFEKNSAAEIILHISVNVVITIVVSVVVGYLMVILLEKLKSQVKLFLLIAVLILLYSIGKLLHFSSLIMILVFGMILNNSRLFFAGKLKSLVNLVSLKMVQNDFQILTMESAFFIRTFFFVIFGMTLDLSSLADLKTGIISLVIVAGIFLIRLITLKIFSVKRLFPELFISPRGLITILLFFSIPASNQVSDFNTGILLYIILITNIIMAISLMAKGRDREYAEKLNFDNWEDLDREIEASKKRK